MRLDISGIMETAEITESLNILNRPRSSEVGLVTVNYHSEKYIQRLLESLDQGEQKRNFDVVVVSNSGPIQGIDLPPDILVIEAPGNIGFGRATNLGSEHLETQYILVANPDVQITTEMVATLVHLLNTYPEYGLVAPYLCSEGPMVFQPTGRIVTENSIGIPDKSIYGACFLIRTELFVNLGGFDENFFMWMEDYDLFQRVINQGMSMGWAEGIVAIHTGSHSTKSISRGFRSFLTWVELSSNCYLIIKNHGVLAAQKWCFRTIFYRFYRMLLIFIQIREPHPRQLEWVSVWFGIQMLLNSYRLKEFVAFNGQEFLWNRTLNQSDGSRKLDCAK